MGVRAGGKVEGGGRVRGRIYAKERGGCRVKESGKK